MALSWEKDFGATSGGLFSRPLWFTAERSASQSERECITGMASGLIVSLTKTLFFARKYHINITKIVVSGGGGNYFVIISARMV